VVIVQIVAPCCSHLKGMDMHSIRNWFGYRGGLEGTSFSILNIQFPSSVENIWWLWSGCLFSQFNFSQWQKAWCAPENGCFPTYHSDCQVWALFPYPLFWISMTNLPCSLNITESSSHATHLNPENGGSMFLWDMVFAYETYTLWSSRRPEFALGSLSTDMAR
jgi:hypothetical protein